MPQQFHVSSLTGIFLLIFSAAGCPAQDHDRPIREVLQSQQAAWNRSDVEAFMSGYEASDATTFVGSSITRGYQRVLEDYHRRYPTKEKMGRLSFSEIEVKPLGAEFASVIGRWHLERDRASGGNVGGIFTLLLRKTPAGWKIILDHTS